jgi:hypothetical protein
MDQMNGYGCTFCMPIDAVSWKNSKTNLLASRPIAWTMEVRFDEAIHQNVIMSHKK